MKEREGIFIGKWPENCTEKEKEFILGYLKQHAKEQTYLNVIYHPDCGCLLDQFVLLDRYPMTPKIISTCPNCKKGCIMEISDPIIFHLPLTEEDYSLDDLKHAIFPESPQKWILEKYRKEI